MTDPTRDELRRACGVAGGKFYPADPDYGSGDLIEWPDGETTAIGSESCRATCASRLVAMVRHMKKHTEYSQEMGSRYQCDLRRELLATDEQRTRAALEVLRAEAESES